MWRYRPSNASKTELRFGFSVFHNQQTIVVTFQHPHLSLKHLLGYGHRPQFEPPWPSKWIYTETMHPVLCEHQINAITNSNLDVVFRMWGCYFPGLLFVGSNNPPGPGKHREIDILRWIETKTKTKQCPIFSVGLNFSCWNGFVFCWPRVVGVVA